jgi:predicted  nucleic acid-binding Zn-ribbon protein
MRWECGECGAQTDEVLEPVVCVECGIASGAFVPAEPEPDDDDLKAAWIRAGVVSRAFLTPRMSR